MNDLYMEMTMQSIIIVVFITCLLPQFFTLLARIYAGYNPFRPLSNTEKLTLASGLAGRALFVKKNSMQGLLIFLPAIWFALHVMVPLLVVYQLCAGYLVVRLLHAICYLAEWKILAGVMELLAFCCCVLLFALSIYFT